ncbi:MAG: hypothetical protein WCK27_31630 [Verrucomicrobiota bacterium]
MRNFLFKPRWIPGLPPPKPPTRLSAKAYGIMFVAVLIIALLWIAGLRLTSIVLTYLSTGRAKRLPLEELPLWHAPVCILFVFGVMGAAAWRFKLIERFVQFIRDHKADGPKS